jgi:phosphatidylinositol glycan class K
LLLGKKIAESRERAEILEAATTNSTVAAPQLENHTSRRLRAAKVALDDTWWGKKAIGAWALAACSSVWLAVSYIESS